MKIFRQGDVLLVETLEEPIGKVSKTGTLALGEVTGHRHRVLGAKVWEEKPNWGSFVEVEEPATIVHEEHNPIELPPAKYKVIHQREYRPRALPRNVVD